MKKRKNSKWKSDFLENIEKKMIFCTIMQIFLKQKIMQQPYNSERLKNYALWYYFKYFPSIQKLQQKLFEKSKDQELSQKIWKSMEHLCDEQRVLEDKIRVYLIRNKNVRYIKTQLIAKWFEKEMIENFLQKEFFDEEKSLLNPISIQHKIQNYKNAGKSKRSIRQKLIESKQDEEIVEEIIQNLFQEDESENIAREYEKLEKKYEKQKIIQKLLQKWFVYNEIKNYVNEYKS